MKMVPMDEITVEATSPQSRWKLPLAETFAMSWALLIVAFPCVAGGLLLICLGRRCLSVLVVLLDLLSDFFSFLNWYVFD